ncbi:MAE_28990/MAE_18760 family HEPN-like nuclease [Rhizobium croatiense]|uniref:MAE_28990/MAE_18760 family HEPN-like nuclease n=1 Tax=Rhizobium croatiense TaxID=2867516 RepID=UPI0023ED6B13|nr:MAE_28990/MAE_18760 family HEPN-like nuclease [Rhizobium croatiense]WET75386.1 MAE_28990/MAE_18760 family HEPN-like nuclease [Rhizobium croatiense]
MSTSFSVIYDEFAENLDALKAVVTAFATPGAGSGKTRVAAANSVTLLLAATFEEFVREMARAYAKALIASCATIDDVPARFIKHVWTRYVDGFEKMQFDSKLKREDSVAAAHARFTVVHEFSNGDLGKDIYEELIHNENNMRPRQINELFTISNVSNLCLLIADKTPLASLFNSTEQGKIHGFLMKDLDDFMDRRNDVAHAVAMSSSSGSDQLEKDIEFLRCIGEALSLTLDALAPLPYAAPAASQPTNSAQQITSPTTAESQPGPVARFFGRLFGSTPDET